MLVGHEATQHCSSSIVAYYHVPPLWIGEAPPRDALAANAAALRETVFQKDLKWGIRVRATRDGLFVFDCTKWAPGAPVRIDGSVRYQESHDQAQAHVYSCIELMNCHVACLNAARSLVDRIGQATGRPITGDEFLSLVRFDAEAVEATLRPTVHPTHALILPPRPTLLHRPRCSQTFAR